MNKQGIPVHNNRTAENVEEKMVNEDLPINVENDLNMLNVISNCKNSFQNSVAEESHIIETTTKSNNNDYIHKDDVNTEHHRTQDNLSPVQNNDNKEQNERELLVVVADQSLKLKKKPKRIAIIDSDSEEELTNDNVPIDNFSDIAALQDEDQSAVAGLNSDSDSDNFLNCDTAEENKTEIKSNNKRKKKLAIVDSDSSDSSGDISKPELNKNGCKSDVDNEENLLEDKEPEHMYQVSHLRNICDSESSEGEPDCETTHSTSNQIDCRTKERYTKRKSTGTALKEKLPKKMNAKEALKQRREITSVSQRMFRETPLYLPYHKPKERTIKEFLQNRPRLSILKTEPNMPASAAIKMTTEELQLVTKKMEERDKEVQKFYESESESEDENQNECSTPLLNNLINTSHPNIIEDTTVLEQYENKNFDSSTNNCIESQVSFKTSEEPNLDKLNEPVNICQSDDNDNSISTNTDNVENKNYISTNDDKAENTEILGDVDGELQHLTTTIVEPEITLNLVDTETSKNDEFLKLPRTEINQEFNSEPDHHLEMAVTTSTTPNKIIVHSIVTIPKQLNNVAEDSVDYDFNLDDIDESNTPKEITADDERLQQLLNRYGSNHTKLETTTTPIFNKHDLLEKLANNTPCLSGDPHEEIDLDEGVIKPNPVSQLVERFMKHAATRKSVTNKVKLDIINLSGGEIRKETVAMSDDSKEEPVESLPKPGVKFHQLRNKLQEQIAQHRADLWKLKNQSLTAEEPQQVDQKTFDSDSDMESDEEEVTCSQTTDGEDDAAVNEIDDEDDKPSAKFAFADDEAEETDVDSEEISCDSSSYKTNEKLGHENLLISDIISESDKKRPLRRILKGFAEDSDDEENASLNSVQKQCDISTASTETWDDDLIIPPHQPRPDKTPNKVMTQSIPNMGLRTPVMQLTGLQSLNSGSKFLHESPISPFKFPISTPTKELSTVKQKLFTDSCDSLQPETNMEELAQLCSGKFPTSECDELQGTKQSQPTTQELLNLCSGGFTGISNSKSDSTLNKLFSKEDALETEKNSPEDDVVVDTIDTTQLTTNLNNDAKYLDEDRIISQLLDEEELEKFKKKFESPDSNLCVVTEVQGGGRLVFDSSDDECTESNAKVTKTVHKKLQFSDDESEIDSEEDNAELGENDEEIDLHDDDNDDNDLNRVFDYDSEENEIDCDLTSVPKEKLKGNDFVENEAELSESEWDSADEDERDLDALEVEQGDADVFDENKIRNDLEKIHMRNILDQDNREIKILQELLLEDGELHGTGRERQFRWKNIDDVANDDGGPTERDDVYLDEDESEEQWRRARHQREMFLKSQQDKNSVDDDVSILSDSNSQVLKIRQECLRTSLSSNAHIEKDKSVPTSSEAVEKRSIFSFQNTRGSFLARTDKFLTRLADMTKVTSTVNIVKTSKKIVFQPSAFLNDNSDHPDSSNKRKADDGTPVAIKKLRLSSNISPSLKGLERKKKLF